MRLWKLSIDEWAKLITAASAVAITIALIYGVISGSTLRGDTVLGKFELTPSSASKISDVAIGQVRQGSSGTVWEARCPKGTEVISGSCIQARGPGVGLQNIGPNRAANQWECAWTAPVEAIVQAVCLKQ